MNPIDTRSVDAAAIRARHREYLWKAVANYYAEPLVPDSAHGTRVRDVDGKEYLDFFAGILTVSVGHGNERVLEAASLQMKRLPHLSSLYPSIPVVQLAETLARITPGRLSKTYFVASGTEADETAVNLAQVHTGHQEIVALRHRYSGRSMLAQSLTAHAPWRSIPTQVAAVKHAAAPYCYRCPFGLTYPSCNVQCARDVEELIRTTTVGQVAGILAEPVLGVGGFITPPKEYFQIVAGIVRRHGGLFLCDEVQTGFGRTGTMFAIEQFGVEPDVMTVAKGIANGFPIAGCIAVPEVADSFGSMTISTFGGNPVSAAAANETIAVLEEEDLPRNARERGAELREGLLALQGKHRCIGDVRGLGLMIGVEIVADEPGGDRTPDAAAANRLLEETRKRGLLIGKGGLTGNTLRLGPPLVITADEVTEALRILGEAFTALES